jgi:hypothetical protein
MKNIMYIIKTLVLISMFTIIGCDDLKLQKRFDFDPDLQNPQPFKDFTAWEYIQTRKTKPNATPAQASEELDYMIEAIQLTGLQSEYQYEGKDRTYLLLNNSSFTSPAAEGGSILKIVTGSDTGTLANGDLDKLRNILKYHIVTSYIDQENTLKTTAQDYLFQSLLPGDNGKIYFTRALDKLIVSVNTTTKIIPPPANGSVVRAHNYIFKNGIGHFLRDVSYNVPF